jgi:hypothetical protein
MDHPALLTAYTRTEAVKVGLLVDVAAAACAIGFTVPVAVTPATWSACVAWAAAPQVNQATPDQLARLDALLACCFQTFQQSVACPAFQLEAVTADAAVLFTAGEEACSVSLKAVMDLSDAAGGPAMTIMLAHEY